MAKRSKVLLIATIIATLYSVYLVTYYMGANAESEGIEAVSAALATALVLPHMVMFCIGTVFGWLGVFLKAVWAALVAAILYSVGTLLFPMYIVFGAPILILGFVGFAKQKKINKTNVE